MASLVTEHTEVHLYPLGVSPPVEAVIRAVARRPVPAVLDSAQANPARGRYTIVACEPIRVVEFALGGPDPFEAMRGHLAASKFGRKRCPTQDLPFVGGWIGFFAYEAGRYIERLPATVQHDVGLPVARWALYSSAAILDRISGRWTIAAVDLPGDPSYRADTHAPSRQAGMWREILAEAQRLTRSPLEVARAASPRDLNALSPAAVHNMPREKYQEIVAQARAYIAAGDIFQVNLARRETFTSFEPPVQTYLRLRRSNPGAYSAFLAWEDARQPAEAVAVLSSSPELFLQLRRREVLTRPIKGTRPRDADSAVDERLRHELAVSTKDRAELAMIVDLERNDLGRVCEFGSIRVLAAEDSPARPYELETHPTVHHLVANVVGRLAEDRDPIDLLRATFPGGSITGAPKVRAMQIIDELELTERTVYTGCIGCFSLDGNMTMNIAIRTLIQSRGLIHLYTGGGIVADSTPEAEYDETCAKALGMRRALAAAP